MTYQYGEFSQDQISTTKEKMRKQIFFLLVIVDPKTAAEYRHIDVYSAFENVLTMFGGLNDLLGYPTEFVRVMALLDAAFIEYKRPSFSWEKYRKLILDAGSAVLNIKEG